MKGAIRIHPDIIQHPVLYDGERLRAFLWLVCRAAQADCVSPLHPSVEIKRGHLLASAQALASHWAWSRSSVNRILRRFESERMVTISIVCGRMMIGIVDYEVFGPAPHDAIPYEEVGHRHLPSERGRISRSKFRDRAREPITAALRKYVLERDGSSCRYCGSNDGPFDIDHILAVANGGSNDPSNLCVACSTCNRSKGARTLEELGWLHG